MLQSIRIGTEAGKLDGLQIDRIAHALGHLADFLLSRAETVETIGGFAIATVRDGRTGVNVTGLGLSYDGALSIETHRVSRIHTPGSCSATTVARDKLKVLSGAGVIAEIVRPNAVGDPEKSNARMNNKSHLRQVLAKACLTVAGIAAGKPHESLFGSPHLLNRIANLTDPAELFYTQPLSSALTEGIAANKSLPAQPSEDYFWQDAA